jgi:hypothetical protein
MRGRKYVEGSLGGEQWVIYITPPNLFTGMEFWVMALSPRVKGILTMGWRCLEKGSPL